jgi:hypothetical protein
VNVVWLIWIAILSQSFASSESLSVDTASYGAYYESLEWDYKVKDGKLRTEVTGSLNVLNPRGQEVASLSVWESPFRRFDDVKIEVTNAQGAKVYSRKKKDMIKVCGFGPSGELFSDVCHHTVDLPSPGYPYNIDYRYIVETEFFFQVEPAIFQRSVPVKSAVCRFTAPKDFKVNHKVYGLDIRPVESESNDEISYEWRAEDISPPPEVGYPPEIPAVPARVAFMPEKFSFEGHACNGWTWKDMGLWYKSLASDRYLPETAHEASGPPDSDVLQAISSQYKRVVDNNRYVAVEIGIGGWQPHPARWTEEHGYGDCKDLTTLLLSYLREKSIQAYPVLVSTRGNGVIDPDFPSVDFNHVITMAIAGNDTVWLDPTCNLCSFGDLPPDDEGIYGLVVTDSGGILLHTPSSPAELNTVYRKTRLHVLPDHKVTISMHVAATGNQAQFFRGRLRGADRKDSEKFVKLLCCGDPNACVLTSFEFSSPEDVEQPVEIMIVAQTIKPVSAIENVIYLKSPLRSVETSYDTIDFAGRRLPVYLGYRHSSTEDMTITWDPDLRIDSVQIPADTTVTCAYAVWRRTSSTSADTVTIALSEKFVSEIVPLDGLNDFEFYIDARREARKPHVRLWEAQ